MLASGGDGGRDLVRFGGAKNEDSPLGWLFDGLQQRVEGFIGDLVRFVDDEDFVAVAGGLVANVFAQLTHFVDTAIGGGIDFDDVGRASGGDFETAGADVAGVVGGALNAVEAAGENAGGGGFAGPSLARENVTVSDTPLFDGVAQGGFDVVLVQEIVKRLGAVFASNNLIRLAGCRRRA